MMMHRKEHITQEGLLTILSLRASFNLGLSENLKTAFPDIIPVIRPKVDNIAIPHGEWLAGFTSGEGCFFVFVSKSSTHALGHRVQLVFQITQHSRDIELIGSLITYFGCGRLAKSEFDEPLSRAPSATFSGGRSLKYNIEFSIQNLDLGFY